MSAFIGELEFSALVVSSPSARLSFFSWLSDGRADAQLDHWIKRYSTIMSRNRGKAPGRLSSSLNAALFLPGNFGASQPHLRQTCPAPHTKHLRAWRRAGVVTQRPRSER